MGQFPAHTRAAKPSALNISGGIRDEFDDPANPNPAPFKARGSEKSLEEGHRRGSLISVDGGLVTVTPSTESED